MKGLFGFLATVGLIAVIYAGPAHCIIETIRETIRERRK